MVDAFGAGRAFGQKLGKLLEDEVHRIVQDCLYGTDFEFIPKGRLTDLHGKPCTHDGLIVDHQGNPYAVIESKVIQKAKHATEKAAKIVREHPDLKRAHPTLRCSIAVLAGDFTPEPLRSVAQLLCWPGISRRNPYGWLKPVVLMCCSSRKSTWR